MNYYNDFDPKVCAWVEQLVHDKLVPAGHIDNRSVKEVSKHDLDGYTQCHFFAGIGGWPLALDLAGWPTRKQVWTGSAPCQPFSNAGQRKGAKDPRHLWPEFYRLIRECKPDTIFGEQVASAVGHGWLDGISADLERENYACGAIILGAHSVGAPHVRQRLYWVADRHGRYAGPEGLSRGRQHGRSSRVGRLVRAPGRRTLPAELPGRGRGPEQNGRLGDVCGPGLAQRSGEKIEPGAIREKGHAAAAHGALDAWRESAWLLCTDGKARRVKPGILPLAHGVPGRVGLIRGYGNAIVPQTAAAFITAYRSLTCPRS